jgi:hypothetical protein
MPGEDIDGDITATLGQAHGADCTICYGRICGGRGDEDNEEEDGEKDGEEGREDSNDEDEKGPEESDKTRQDVSNDKNNPDPEAKQRPLVD